MVSLAFFCHIGYFMLFSTIVAYFLRLLANFMTIGHPFLKKYRIFGGFLPFWLRNISSSFQSGSQNDLVDSWRDESSEATGVSSQTTSEAIAGANARWNTPPAPTSQRHLSAEYPFHKNLCMPPQGINFDLTHKRGE